MKIEKFDFNVKLAQLPFEEFEKFYNSLSSRPKEKAEDVYKMLGGKVEKKTKAKEESVN